jgi:NhaP-type Na+/H+ or K+/H+ antiporter
MEQLNASVAMAAGVVMALGLFSGIIKRSVLSIPILALAAGVAAGPEALGWLSPEEWPEAHTILKEAARFTLAISVTGIAMRTPVEDFRKLARPVLLLLSVGMLAMWAVSAALAGWLLGLAPLAALLLGAIVTPTDPVVASSIVTGAAAEEKLPDALRSTLSLESGANDGLGYLLVMLPLVFWSVAPSGTPWVHWLTDVLGIGIVLAVVIGGAIGGATGLLLKYTDRHGLIEKHSLLSLGIAMSLLALTGAKLAGSDGILASFAAGAVFNATVRRKEDFAEENIQEAISKLFNLPVFVILGAMLPWQGWAERGWTALGLAIAVILLRRPIALLVTGWALGPRLTRADALFLAWFGPVGIAALYYGLHAEERTGDPLFWEISALVIAVSVVAHGVTATLGLALRARA